ncbi:hypothetical protein NSP_51680 [Nodularia spumigena CCY9414]|nr:hypothetical protein NSP_51680 [Nodularia spumigena CCY9414]
MSSSILDLRFWILDLLQPKVYISEDFRLALAKRTQRSEYFGLIPP